MTVRMASAGLELEHPYTLAEHRRLAERLRRFPGRMIAEQDRLLGELVGGPRVLEIGCGYGGLVKTLRARGLTAVGVDLDVLGLIAGREVLGDAASLVAADAEHPPFRPESFDCVVFRDSWHHLDHPRALAAARRLTRRRLVILDPNITPMLRIARRLIGHVDEEAPVEETVAVLAANGWIVERVVFRDVVALPLSGGYIGVELVPPVRPLQNALLAVDRIAASVANRLGVARWLCWRYIVVARPREA